MCVCVCCVCGCAPVSVCCPGSDSLSQALLRGAEEADFQMESLHTLLYTIESGYI